MIAWIDLETTGLNPQKCSIIEVACILTDEKYVEVAEFSEIVRPPAQLTFWEPYAEEMHQRNGLFDLVNSAAYSIEDIDETVAHFLDMYSYECDKKFTLGGSSVHFDKSFIDRWMLKTSNRLDYRILDVSSLKIFFSNALGVPREQLPPRKSDSNHRALDDIRNSIAAAQSYTTLMPKMKVEPSRHTTPEERIEQNDLYVAIRSLP